MWSHEIEAGRRPTWIREEIQRGDHGVLRDALRKKDQDLKVGNLLTLEGGVAYNVPKIGGAFGMGYYLQNKLSDDSGADVPVARSGRSISTARTGCSGSADVTMAVFQHGGTIGLVNARYLWESAGRARFRAARSLSD